MSQQADRLWTGLPKTVLVRNILRPTLKTIYKAEARKGANNHKRLTIRINEIVNSQKNR